MRRTTLFLVPVLLAIALPLPVEADTPAVCAWGGGPTVRNGTFTSNPGLRNVPHLGETSLVATGYLTGDHARCTGIVTLDAVLTPGSGCAAFVDGGPISGLPGVARADGGGGALSAALLRDAAGIPVGSYVVLARSNDAIPFSGVCASEEGFSSGTFGATVELW